MPTEKREARAVMLFDREDGRGETVRRVTRLAGASLGPAAELAAVRIGMAVGAAGGLGDCSRARGGLFLSSMTSGALHRGVASLKREARVGVIETPGCHLRPPYRCVAILAALFEPALVRVAVA